MAASIRLAALAAGLALSGCLGNPVPQDPVCAAYVACIRAQDAASGLTTDLRRFEAEGDCWANKEIAHLCSSGCARGLEHLRAHVALLPAECAP